MIAIEAKSALTPAGGFLAGTAAVPGFTHSFSPAVGCALGASACGAFCYAQFLPAHRMRGAAHGAWGGYLLIKRNAPEVLRRELVAAARRAPGDPRHLSRIRVFSASATEPLAGPCFDVYRRVMHILAEYPPAAWALQTRSPRVVELQQELAALRGRVIVSMTLETDDDAVFRWLPGGGPSVAARRRAVESLRALGVPVHAALSPLLPLRDAGAFAAWLAAHADLVTVDTAVAGDGTGRGARTRRTALPGHLADKGVEWSDESSARRFLDALRTRIGRRAAWSCEGFARLADPASWS